VRSTNNETPVELFVKLRTGSPISVCPLWGFRYDFIKIYKRISSPLFFKSVFIGFLSSFPALLALHTRPAKSANFQAISNNPTKS